MQGIHTKSKLTRPFINPFSNSKTFLFKNGVQSVGAVHDGRQRRQVDVKHTEDCEFDRFFDLFHEHQHDCLEALTFADPI